VQATQSPIPSPMPDHHPGIVVVIEGRGPLAVTLAGLACAGGSWGAQESQRSRVKLGTLVRSERYTRMRVIDMYGSRGVCRGCA
jgi:hypothetical protein